MPAKISYSYNKPDHYYSADRDQMVKYIPANVKKILEVGCGFGNFSRLLKDTLNTENWAVEIDEKAAKVASEKIDKVINTDIAQAMAQLPDDYFDCAVFNDVLSCIPDPFSMLSGIKNKLTSGGVIVASIPNVRHWRTLRDLVLRGQWDYREFGILDTAHVRFYTYKSLVKMFDELGYEIVKLEGLNPSRNKGFRILNFLCFNKFWDARYSQFACVVRPKNDEA